MYDLQRRLAGPVQVPLMNVVITAVEDEHVYRGNQDQTLVTVTLASMEVVALLEALNTCVAVLLVLEVITVGKWGQT